MASEFAPCGSPNFLPQGYLYHDQAWTLGGRNAVLRGYYEHSSNKLPEAITPRRYWPEKGESWEDYGAGSNIPTRIAPG